MTTWHVVSLHVPASLSAPEVPVPEQFTYSHPSERIRSSVENAIARLHAMCDRKDAPEWVKTEADRLILALFDVPSDGDAMQLAIDRRDEDMRGVLQSNYAYARRITELETRLGGITELENAAKRAASLDDVSLAPRRAASGE